MPSRSWLCVPALLSSSLPLSSLWNLLPSSFSQAPSPLQDCTLRPQPACDSCFPTDEVQGVKCSQDSLEKQRRNLTTSCWGGKEGNRPAPPRNSPADTGLSSASQGSVLMVRSLATSTCSCLQGWLCRKPVCCSENKKGN